MADYKLNYTAEEINNKLGKVEDGGCGYTEGETIHPIDPKFIPAMDVLTFNCDNGRQYELTVKDGQLSLSITKGDGGNEIVTFTISRLEGAGDTTTYNCENSMTWREWVYSEYNPHGPSKEMFISSDTVGCDEYYYVTKDGSYDGIVEPDDAIISGWAYKTIK